MALKWTPDNILIRAIGAVGLAGVDAFLNHRTNQLTSFLRNGDMVDWLVIAADLFNVAPDGTTGGAALDAATDAAIFDLAHSLFAGRLSSIIPTEFGLGTVTAEPVPSAATAASAGPATASAPPVAPLSTGPIPAANMSAAGDVATAGY